MSVFRRIFGYVRPFWTTEVLAYASMFGINALRLIWPLVIRTIIDTGIEQNRSDVLRSSLLLLLGLTAARAIMRFGMNYLSERVAQNVAYVMRNEMYRKLQSLSFSYHDRSQTGQLLSRMTTDVDRIRRFTGHGLLRLVESLVLLIATPIFLVRMNPLLATLSLSLMPAIGIFMRFYVKHMHPLWRLRQDRVAKLTSRLEQNLQGVQVVRGFAQEDAEIQRFGEATGSIYDVSTTLTRTHSFGIPLVILLASLGTLLVLWIGGRLVIAGQLTLGELIAFNTYLAQLVQPMRRLGFIATLLGESHASAQRVFEVLDTKSDVADRPGAKDIGRIRGAVAFEDVSFSYFRGSPVLSNLSFEVEPGQVVALVGPTGSGKSSIISLIPRFYDVTYGTVRIDGMDVRSVTIASLRSQIGIVLQETMLFGSTIRENIAFGRPEATLDEIEAAARAAAAHDFIVAFPDSYDTRVGERGTTLSGGQRQRIAIARALLLDPRILILDDATSSVDTETEQQIQAALGNLMHGRTSFIIAQRVSTVRNADQVLVIDRGSLVARGTHSELIRESGIYADIYYRQLRQEPRSELNTRRSA